jgi:hypothetical protein
MSRGDQEERPEGPPATLHSLTARSHLHALSLRIMRPIVSPAHCLSSWPDHGDGRASPKDAVLHVRIDTKSLEPTLVT